MSCENCSALCWWARQESNLDPPVMSRVLSPLSYGPFGGDYITVPEALSLSLSAPST